MTIKEYLRSLSILLIIILTIVSIPFIGFFCGGLTGLFISAGIFITIVILWGAFEMAKAI